MRHLSVEQIVEIKDVIRDITRKDDIVRFEDKDEYIIFTEAFDKSEYKLYISYDEYLGDVVAIIRDPSGKLIGRRHIDSIKEQDILMNPKLGPELGSSYKSILNLYKGVNRNEGIQFRANQRTKECYKRHS